MTEEPVPAGEISLRIHKGDANPEDIAAIIAIVGSLAAQSSIQSQTQSQGSLSSWNNKELMFRHFPTPGPGAWRASGLFSSR